MKLEALASELFKEQAVALKTKVEVYCAQGLTTTGSADLAAPGDRFMDRFDDKLHGSLAHYRSLNEKVLRSHVEEVIAAAQDDLRVEFCNRFPPSDPSAIDSAEFGGAVNGLIGRKQQVVREELRSL